MTPHKCTLGKLKADSLLRRALHGPPYSRSPTSLAKPEPRSSCRCATRPSVLLFPLFPFFDPRNQSAADHEGGLSTTNLQATGNAPGFLWKTSVLILALPLVAHWVFIGNPLGCWGVHWWGTWISTAGEASVRRFRATGNSKTWSALGAPVIAPYHAVCRILKEVPGWSDGYFKGGVDIRLCFYSVL